MATLPIRAVCGWLAALSLLMSPAQAEVSADRLKITYIQNFLSMVRWGDIGMPGELHLCTFPDSRLGSQILETLHHKTVAGQLVIGQSIATNNLQLTGCHVMFIPESMAPYAPGLLARASTYPLLTISDMPSFVDQGGMIGFVIDQDKLRFEINQQAAARHNLRISAKLLELARRVIQ